MFTTQRSKLLQVVSIIMVIGGALAILTSLMGILGGSLMATQYAVLGGIFILTAILGIVSGIIELVAGIIGAKNWQNPDKAKSCIIMGVIIIVIALVNIIISTVSAGFTTNTLFSILLSLVLPVLYLVGAFQLKGRV